MTGVGPQAITTPADGGAGPYIGPDVSNDAAASASELADKHFVEFFGPPKYKLPYNNQRWQRETLSLPDVYHGYNNHLTVFLMEEISENDLWLFRFCFPIIDKGFETTHCFHRISFDSTMLGTTPEQSVPRLLTMNKEEHTGALERKGVALMLEHGFWRSPIGQQSYAMQLKQIRNACLDSLMATMMTELLRCSKTHVTWMNMYGANLTPSGLTMARNEEIHRFALLQKDISGWDILNKMARDRMMLSGREPDTCILPFGGMSYVVAQRGHAYYARGEDGLMAAALKGKEALHEEFNRRNGTTIYEFKLLHVPGESRPIQMLERPRSIGEYFYFPPPTNDGRSLYTSGRYTSRARDVMIYDESADEFVMVSLLDAIKHSQRFGGVHAKSGDLIVDAPVGDESDREDLFGTVTQSTLPGSVLGHAATSEVVHALFGHLPVKTDTVDRVSAKLPTEAVLDWSASVEGLLARRFGQDEVYKMRTALDRLHRFVRTLYEETPDKAYLEALHEHLQTDKAGEFPDVSGGTANSISTQIVTAGKLPFGFASYAGLKELTKQKHRQNLEKVSWLSMVDEGVDALERTTRAIVDVCGEDGCLFADPAHATPVFGKFLSDRFSRECHAVFENLFFRPLMHYVKDPATASGPFISKTELTEILSKVFPSIESSEETTLVNTLLNKIQTKTQAVVNKDLISRVLNQLLDSGTTKASEKSEKAEHLNAAINAVFGPPLPNESSAANMDEILVSRANALASPFEFKDVPNMLQTKEFDNTVPTGITLEKITISPLVAGKEPGSFQKDDASTVTLPTTKIVQNRMVLTVQEPPAGAGAPASAGGFASGVTSTAPKPTDISIAEFGYAPYVPLVLTNIMTKNMEDLRKKVKEDHMTRVFAFALMGTKLTFGMLERFANNDIVIPFSVLAFRPYMTYQMASAIWCKSGRETAETLVSDANFQLGDDAMRKIHWGAFTMRMGAAVYQEENVYVCTDIMSTRYYGGSSTVFFKSPEDLQSYAPTFHGPAMFAVLVPYRRSTKYGSDTYPVAMHVSGKAETAHANTDEDYVGANFYRGIWGWDMGGNSTDAMESTFEERSSVPNTLCMFGGQINYDPATGGHTRVLQNRGHWGNTYPGCGRIRGGLGGVLQTTVVDAGGVHAAASTYLAGL